MVLYSRVIVSTAHSKSAEKIRLRKPQPETPINRIYNGYRNRNRRNWRRERLDSLSSSHSTQISLEAVRNGKAGLDAHRQRMLDKVPKQGNWASFTKNSIELKDLAYLTAKIGDEFALLRGKHEDILYHGSRGECTFKDELEKRLKNHQLELVGHAHPGEPVPIPSRLTG